MNRTFKKQSTPGMGLLRGTMRLVSRRLVAQFEAETGANQAAFDSGIPLEDFFRFELGRLLDPYAVEPGHIVDRDGYTCGDCDVVLVEPAIAPLLHRQTAPSSRRRHFAFESTYGIVEVKQTLTLGALESDGSLSGKPKGTLWDACEKIFAYKQLVRDQPGPVTWGVNHPIGIAFFYASAEDYSTEASRDALLKEFIAINRLVDPKARVNAVFVLDRFSLNWAFRPDATTTSFLTLQHCVEIPTGAQLWATFQATGEDTFYGLFTHLWSTLGRTQLAAPDLVNQYGGQAQGRGSLRAMSAP